MRNILIIGCGLLGSSLVRKISQKKNSEKNIHLRKIAIKYR
jgi:saccharopine dehydrogenase-like NADP-dependent oxidoreductase